MFPMPAPPGCPFYQKGNKKPIDDGSYRKPTVVSEKPDPSKDLLPGDHQSCEQIARTHLDAELIDPSYTPKKDKERYPIPESQGLKLAKEYAGDVKCAGQIVKEELAKNPGCICGTINRIFYALLGVKFDEDIPPHE